MLVRIVFLAGSRRRRLVPLSVLRDVGRRWRDDGHRPHSAWSHRAGPAERAAVESQSNYRPWPRCGTNGSPDSANVARA
jgi:hypothetical protein